MAGTREDASGDLLARLLEADGYEVERRVVADETAGITAALRDLGERAALVLTTGGTGSRRATSRRRRPLGARP